MRYALLFRALNIGGHNVVKMAELAQLLAASGLVNVRTVLQSGNAVGESDLSESELEERVRSAFHARFGFDSAVLVREESALRAVLAALPFSDEEQGLAQAADPAVEHVYVYFLPRTVDRERLAPLLCEDPRGDTVRVSEGALYLLCAQSVRLSKAAVRIAHALPDATARNLRTLRRLCALAENG